jgi:uncharacterized SAM-binding protein YcdF (DUF218 family)
MTFSIFLLLAALAVVLLAWRRRRSGIAAAAAAVVWLWLAGCGPLTGWLLGSLQDGFPTAATRWGSRNVIILLGAGTVRGDGGDVEPALYANARILKAAQLYHACKASGADCRLEVSGGDAVGLKRSEADTYASVLQDVGVPRGDLLLEGRSRNTFENARFSKPLLDQYGADHVVIVSSGVHLKRALLYFAHFGVQGQAVRADYVRARYDWLPGTDNLFYADFALHEYVGVWRYHVYNALGWNAPRVPEEKPTAPTTT